MTPRLTRAQAREIDRAAIEDYAIPGIVLMENAARALATRALAMLESSPGPVVILCGPGNNGGDGFALARLLHNAHVDVRLLATRQLGEYIGDAAINARIIERMRIPLEIAVESTQLPDCALLVDALFGTGLTSAPRGVGAELIDAINAHPARTLAVDLPSGLDCDTGEALGACVRAGHTVTFVAMKAGFANPASRAYTGDVSVGDIGAPRELVQRLGECRD